MKIIWGAEDINPGRRYSKKNIGETWIIGYRSDTDDDVVRYVSISENDGMVTIPYTKEGLAEILTEYGYIPVELLEIGYEFNSTAKEGN